MMIKCDTSECRHNNRNICVYILCIILLAFSFVVRYPNYENKTYRNEDAVYHMLLTIRAYDETPVSEHHFVPLVSLGGVENKGIPWGATVADEKGNYFYTSFSSAGFVAPYIFIKILHLPICEKSLYLFSSILLVGSLLVLIGLMIRLFNGKLQMPYICILTVVIYLFSPEIMHSQGVIYWHQSLFQLTFLIQLYAYQRFRESNSKKAFALFVLLAILNPYIEWSGFVGNIGFALAELLFSIEKKEGKRYIPVSSIVRVIVLAMATLVAAGLFVLQFLSVIPAYDFFKAMFSRFNSRNVLTNSSLLLPLFKGYCTSFGLSSLLLIGGALFVVARGKQTRNRALNVLRPTVPILFVSVFTMLENILMLQHAVSYSFDRMKLVIPLTILLLTVVCSLEKKKRVNIVVGITALGVIACNSIFYLNSASQYAVTADYLVSNREFAEEVLTEFQRDDTIFIQENCSTRGYANLLWDGGVYEWTSIEDAKLIAEEKNKRYIACLKSTDHWWNMYEYTECEIFDMLTCESAVIKN